MLNHSNQNSGVIMFNPNLIRVGTVPLPSIITLIIPELNSFLKGLNRSINGTYISLFFPSAIVIFLSELLNKIPACCFTSN